MESKYLNITTDSARNAAHCIVYDNIEKLHPKFNALVNEANEYIKEHLKIYYGEALYNYVFERIDNFLVMLILNIIILKQVFQISIVNLDILI